MTAYRHLLVGTDGSDTAAHAVRQAALLAQAFGARLTVMTVFTDAPPSETAQIQEQLPDELRWQVTGAAQAEETAHQGVSVAKTLGADAHARVERGEPAEAIIRALDAGDFDLVVVGSRGLSSPTRFLLGNVPNAVSHHAPCDVAIIHTT